MVAEAPRLPPPSLRLARAPWDAACDAFAARVPFDAPTEHRDGLRRECAEGRATCWKLADATGRELGMIVTRVETEAARELVLVAIFADTPPDSPPLTSAIATLCEDLARRCGCQSIRFHTSRPAVARVAAEQHGFRLAEMVMRKAITPAPVPDQP